MKKVRLIVYEGNLDWLDISWCFSKPVGKTSFGANNSITVIEDLSEISNIIQQVEAQKEFDNSILPEETIGEI